MTNIEWYRSNNKLPKINEDVLAFNEDTWEIEIGFRSAIDIDPIHWVDFHFPVTHWAYVNIPEDSNIR